MVLLSQGRELAGGLKGVILSHAWGQAASALFCDQARLQVGAGGLCSPGRRTGPLVVLRFRSLRQLLGRTLLQALTAQAQVGAVPPAEEEKGMCQSPMSFTVGTGMCKSCMLNKSMAHSC